jgi:hypothetical protein
VPEDDGTTHLRFAPAALLERLAVLIPRPRINLVLYYGLLAPRRTVRSAELAAVPLIVERPQVTLSRQRGRSS